MAAATITVRLLLSSRLKIFRLQWDAVPRLYFRLRQAVKRILFCFALRFRFIGNIKYSYSNATNPVTTLYYFYTSKTYM